MGSFKSTPKKSKSQRKSSPSHSEAFTQENLSTIKPPNSAKKQNQAFSTQKDSQQPFKFTKQQKPNFRQQRNCFVKQDSSIPEDQPSNLEVEWTLTLLMLPLWIFLKIKWSRSEFTIFQKVFDQIWLLFEFFLSGWNLFPKLNP